MTKDSSLLGREGEKAAVKFLKKEGYRILEKNFRSKGGEIDIIAEHNQTVVFVEVKTRASTRFGHPTTAVNSFKRNKIKQLAQTFLSKNKVEDRECRFDVVSIIGSIDDPKNWQIELFPDAFRF